MLSSRDLGLIAVTLVVALLPWGLSSLMVALVGLILMQGLALGVALGGGRPLEWTHWGLDATLVAAASMVRFSWTQDTAQWALGPALMAVLLQIGFVRAMAHHSVAHQKMQQDSEPALQSRLEAIDSDLSSGLLTPEEAQHKWQQMQAEACQAVPIFRLGRQTMGVVLVQLALLLSSRPDSGLWLVWTFTISLSTLLNSKTQDAMLAQIWPRDRLLC